MQKFIVAPTELTRETPYLQHHIAATQWVNFIEDPLSPKQNGPVAAADLHKFEIKNALLIR